jgi:hypothetical protein
MEGCDELVLNLRENFFLENKLIGDIVKEYPDATMVMKKYFGKDCLKMTGFKIKTLEMACILFGIDPNRLIEEINKAQN